MLTNLKFLNFCRKRTEIFAEGKSQKHVGLFGYTGPPLLSLLISMAKITRTVAVIAIIFL